MTLLTRSFIIGLPLSQFALKQKYVYKIKLSFNYHLRTNNSNTLWYLYLIGSKWLINQLKVDHKLVSTYLSLDSHTKNITIKKATYILLSALLELVITFTTDCGSFSILPLLFSINFLIYWILFYSSNEIASWYFVLKSMFKMPNIE